MADEAGGGPKKNPRELKLSGGKTVSVNLNGWTWADVREYARLEIPEHLPDRADFANKADETAYRTRREQSLADEKAAMRRIFEMRAKVCNLEPDEIENLGWEDQALLGKKINSLIVDPVGADPS